MSLPHRQIHGSDGEQWEGVHFDHDNHKCHVQHNFHSTCRVKKRLFLHFLNRQVLIRNIKDKSQGDLYLCQLAKFPIFMNDSQHMYLILIIDGFILTQCSAKYLKPKAVSYLGKALYTTDTPPCSPTGSRSVGRWSGGCTS